jgi:NitT/TauT family transport system ATP-binding protein
MLTDDAGSAASGPPVVSISHVSKSYAAPFRRLLSRLTPPPQPALLDVNLDVPRSEIVAILGPSGCGKTTLLNIVAGLVTPSAGEVRVNGAIVTGPGRGRAKVFQEDAVLPWRTARQNVELALELRGVPDRERSSRAHQHLSLVGIQDFPDHFPSQLSSGARQRLQLATVIASAPEVMLIDEPFGALDLITKEELQLEFDRVVAGRGITALFVTHDIEEALFLADRVVLLAGRPGRIRDAYYVPFPRPRELGLKTTTEFQRMRRDVKDRLRRWHESSRARPSVVRNEVTVYPQDLVSCVGHDIRTPLTSILAFAELLASAENSGPMTRDLAADIGRQALRIERLVNDLLDVSRLEMGSLTLELRAVDIGLLVRDTAADLAESVLSRHEVRCNCSDGQLVALADAKRTARILCNLLTNAASYAAIGTRIDLECSRVSSVDTGPSPPMPAGDWISVRVEDSGIGIPVSEITRVFDRHYRASNAVAQRSEGTGLGLYIAQSFAQHQSGHLMVEPSVTGGCRFTLLLPTS